MATLEFKGFGGVRLEAECVGDEHDPAILLVHGAGQSRAVWDTVGEALLQAGRRVIALDLRGHGGSEWPVDGRYDLDAYVEDLRAVMAQLGSRAVVVAAGFGGWIAALALAGDGGTLAAGLVLVDVPIAAPAGQLGHAATSLQCDPRAAATSGVDPIPAHLQAAAPGLALPMLVVRGALDTGEDSAAAAEFDAALANAEAATIGAADLRLATGRSEAFVGRLLDFLERKQPRSAHEFRAGSDARTLRDALGCFATGITIVTTIDPDGVPVGLTANSFTSVSLEPPLLLVCIANTATTAAVLRGAQHFAVNLLQIGQQPASNRFAGRGVDRFAQTAWSPGETGVPLLHGSLGAFECHRQALYEAGDHFILVGEVVRAQFEPRRDPLLYFRGKYRRLHFA